MNVGKGPLYEGEEDNTLVKWEFSKMGKMGKAEEIRSEIFELSKCNRDSMTIANIT
jgi:hypothetical protein